MVVQSIGLDVSAVFSIHQNPKEVNANASEGMDLLSRRKAGRQRTHFLLPCLLSGLPADGVARIKAGSSHLGELD